MKTIKRTVLIMIVAMLLLPFAVYSVVVIANNCIADGIERDLRSVELPPNTTLVESFSIAGKMFGNGNGMQYIGVILVKSELPLEDLEAHYQSKGECIGEYISVRKQDGSAWLGVHTFMNFDTDANYYAIDCMKTNMSHYEDSGFIWKLLDIDLRGH